jgi:hypothetical protein
MTTTKTLSRSLPAIVIAVGLATDIAAARGFSICAERNAMTREMTLHFANGCVSSSRRYLGHDIKADVNQIHASIRISGGSNYEPLPAGRPVKADCGGRRSHSITVPETDARRYRVSHNGNYAGLIDLTAANGRVCSRTLAKGGNPNLRFDDWQPVDLSGWVPKSASSLMDVIAPVYSGHPESTEGRPGLKIEMAPWHGRDAMHVQVTMTGYLDDSVSGETFAALVEPGGDGWVLKKLWKKNLCARGQHAGQWTKQPCP